MGAGSKPLRPWQVCAGDVIGSGKRVEYVFERYGELYINASDEELVRQGRRTCVCGKEGLRYVYTIANTETGETLSPIGSSCIKKFEQSDMDEELAGWQQAIKLMEEAARIGKEDYVHLHSGSYSRKLLYFLYEQDAFRPTKYNEYDGYNDYLFLLDMFNGGFCSEAQERKCQAIIMQFIYPWLRNLWKKSKSQKGKIDNGK